MIATLEPQSLGTTTTEIEVLPPAPPVPVPTARRHPNLLLHCGAQAASLLEVVEVPTPRATASWHPIPHVELIDRVEHTIRANGLALGTQAHSLSRDGQRYFGLMEVLRRESDADYCWVLGLRNSHDKSFPAGIVAGSAVFCCDNLVRREA